MRTSSTVLFAVLAALAPAGAVFGAEQAAPPAVSSAAAAQPMNEIDLIHRDMSEVLIRPICWFDSFFMPLHEEIATNKSFLRVVGGYEWNNGSGIAFRRAIRSKLRLPGLDKRFKLILSDDEPDTEAPAAAGHGAITPSEVPQVKPGERQSASIRFEAFNWMNSILHLDVGVRAKWKLQVSGHIGHKIPLDRIANARISLTPFWLQGTGFGERLRLDAERLCTDQILVAYNSALTHIEKKPGTVLDNRLTLSRQLTHGAGISVGFGATTTIQDLWRPDVYTASIVFRQRLHKDWLYYEAEPGINWKLTGVDNYPGIPTMGLRLEAQFSINGGGG